MIKLRKLKTCENNKLFNPFSPQNKKEEKKMLIANNIKKQVINIISPVVLSGINKDNKVKLNNSSGLSINNGFPINNNAISGLLIMDNSVTCMTLSSELSFREFWTKCHISTRILYTYGFQLNNIPKDKKC